MTKRKGAGSSLSQVQRHYRHAQHSHHHHARLPLLKDFQKPDVDHAHLADSRLEIRQASASPSTAVVTEVVEVSVIKVIDGTGTVFEVKTVVPTSSLTLRVNSVAPTGSISGLPVTADSSRLKPVAASGDGSSSTSMPSSNDATNIGSVPLSATASSSQFLSTSLSADHTSVTSTPLTTSLTAFSSLAGLYNATRTSSAQSSSSPSAFANITTLSTFVIKSTTSDMSASSISSALTHSFSRSIAWPTSMGSNSVSATATPTDRIKGAEYGNDGPSIAGVSGTATVITSASATQTAAASSGGIPTEQGALVGGVVGGVAGIAILLFILMFFFKWKKKQMGRIRILGATPPALPLSFSGGRGGVGGPGDGCMAERYSAPFATPSTVASFTGKRSSRGQSSHRSGERGFYRVSGKKLTSVLTSGGDGYSEPLQQDSHHSMVSETSDTSVLYRDSQIFLGGEPVLSRLQLGTPMRPESGVMVMKPGPARRTPVQEPLPYSPFSDSPPFPLTPP